MIKKASLALLPVLLTALRISCEGGLFSKKYSLSLTVTPENTGEIEVSPQLEKYPSGETVTLTAVPDTSWEFVRWIGDLSGTTNPATIEITDDTSVIAEFLESLSVREAAIVGKWRRFHSYDDSYKYLILNDDRTGCYFSIEDDDSRADQFCYAHWELDEENPIDDDVYRIIFTYASGRTYEDDEYHADTDRIWRGGYDTLQMSPIESSEWDCDCGN